MFKNFQCIFTLSLLSSLGDGLSPLPKDDLCQVWLKLAHWFWRKRFLNAGIDINGSPIARDK
jgi:hypothetical protein